MDDKFSFDTLQGQYFLRVYVLASMLYIVNYKTFFYFVLPQIFVATAALHSMTETFYSDVLQCPEFVKKYELIVALGEDYTMIILLAIGIYSHCYTLVSRFINSEKAMLQQKHFTKVFHEQPAGLLVLQELPDETPTEKERRLSQMSVVQQINDSVNNSTLDDKVVRYKVKFQNRALENIFGEVGVEK